MKTNLTRVAATVLGTLAEQVIAVSEKPEYTVVKKHPLLLKIKTEYDLYFEVLAKKVYSGLGKSVAQADERVDNAFNALKHILNGHIRLKVQPQAEAAEALFELIARLGVNVYRQSYGSQTENIDKLLHEFRKPGYAQHITTLSIEGLVDELIAAQENFKSIYLQQVSANAALRNEDSATGLRKQLEKALRNYLNLVRSMREEPIWRELHTELNELTKAAANTIPKQQPTDNNTTPPDNKPGA